jgi:glutamate-1-semialdehyde 2,1-aminomutase
VEADLTCLGKIIGGGLPIGAYGGRKDIMDAVAPLGSVYQAGTLSGNPLAMVAGMRTLSIMKEAGNYEKIEKLTERLCQGLQKKAKASRIDVVVNSAAGMFTLFFSSAKVTNFSDARKSDTGLYSKFFNRMLNRGIYMAPSQFEANFISIAHTDEDIEVTLNAAEGVFEEIKVGVSK